MESFSPTAKPHPALAEVKQVYQYIDILPDDLSRGKVKITNSYDFRNLKFAQGLWELRSNGKVVQSGKLPMLNLKPRETHSLTLPLKIPSCAHGMEHMLNISFVTRKELPLVPAGFTVAGAQFALDSIVPELSPRDTDNFPKLNVKRDDKKIKISGQNFEIEFDCGSATLTKYEYDGNKLIEYGPEPDFWRAPIDNDRGNKMPERLGVWKKGAMIRQLRSIKTRNISPREIQLEALIYLPALDADYNIGYTVRSEGSIEISTRFTPGRPLPELPRFGMKMIIPGDFETITWYGRGPYENYSDRKTASYVGLYSGTVSGQFIPYLRPQENGNKTDVRWLALTDSHGAGLLAAGRPLLSVGASHFSHEDIERAEHPSELAARDSIFVNLDLAQMGVGGDNSWGALPHQQYMLPNNEYSYRFMLRPLPAGTNPRQLAGKPLP